MKSFKFVMGFLLASFLSSQVQAQLEQSDQQTDLGSLQRQTHVFQRFHNQGERIERGIQNGSLTATEQERVLQQQGRVQMKYFNAMTDGQISKGEARQIQRSQNRASQTIYNQKHNAVGKQLPRRTNLQRQVRALERQKNQDERIEKGVARGTLTQAEADRLENQQDRIEARRDKALADGKITAREGSILERMQNKASRSIYRQKHDQEREPSSVATFTLAPAAPSSALPSVSGAPGAQ